MLNISLKQKYRHINGYLAYAIPTYTIIKISSQHIYNWHTALPITILGERIGTGFPRFPVKISKATTTTERRTRTTKQRSHPTILYIRVYIFKYLYICIYINHRHLRAMRMGVCCVFACWYSWCVVVDNMCVYVCIFHISISAHWRLSCRLGRYSRF